jgi:hypothetical protein
MASGASMRGFDSMLGTADSGLSICTPKAAALSAAAPTPQIGWPEGAHTAHGAACADAPAAECVAQPLSHPDAPDATQQIVHGPGGQAADPAHIAPVHASAGTALQATSATGAAAWSGYGSEDVWGHSPHDDVDAAAATCRVAAARGSGHSFRMEREVSATTLPVGLPSAAPRDLHSREATPAAPEFPATSRPGSRSGGSGNAADTASDDNAAADAFISPEAAAVRAL